MDSIELISDVKTFCISNADEKAALKYRRYFKEGLYNGYGLSAPLIHEKSRQLAMNKAITLDVALKAAEETIPSGRAEEITIIMLLIKNLHKQFTYSAFKNIEHWFDLGINNWAHADTAGMLILQLFLQKKLITVPDFTKWLTSVNRFQRRCVPVTLIKSLKTQPNYRELFDFIECLMTDPEREVHQGTGWFLREAWKRNHAITEEFLMQWKDKAPRLIIQYATEKMTPEEKSKFKKKVS